MAQILQNSDEPSAVPTPDAKPDYSNPAFNSIPAFVRTSRIVSLSADRVSGRVLETRRTINEAGTEFVDQLVEVNPDVSRALTHGIKSASLLAIGQRGEVYFSREDATDEEKGSALWMLPPTGEAREILRHREGIDSLAVTRSSLVLTLPLMPGTSTLEESNTAAKKRADARISGVLHERFPVRAWDHDLGPSEPHLYTAPLPDLDDVDGAQLELEEVELPQAPEAVDEWRLDGAVPSHDGRVVALTMSTRTGISEGSQVWLASLDNSEPARKLFAPAGEDAWARAFSSDGSWLLVETELPPLAGQALGADLYRVSLDGDSTVLTAAFDEIPSETVVTDDDVVYVCADRRGRGGIYRLLPEGNAELVTPDDEFSYSSLHWLAPEGKLVALRSSVAEANQTVFIDPHTGETETTARIVPDLELPGELTEVSATAEDGTPLRAWLALPEGEGPHPIVVFAHGGPWGSWNGWTWRWNPWVFVARGYAVLLPDPGISTGYGHKMLSRGHDAIGREPFTDILTLADTAVARPDIDEARQAFAGGSYGGYMANWVAGHTGTRFRCIVSHAALWNVESMARTTDNGSWYLWMTGEVEGEGPQIANWSPHNSADAIKVPMLVIHGDKDYRVPLGQGLELWQDLQRLSPELGHKFLYFPDEGHWVLKPANAQMWYETFLEFLDTHVKA